MNLFKLALACFVSLSVYAAIAPAEKKALSLASILENADKELDDKIQMGFIAQSEIYKEDGIRYYKGKELTQKRTCIKGNCQEGNGLVLLKTSMGLDGYQGQFKLGKYHGNGDLKKGDCYYRGLFRQGKLIRGTTSCHKEIE